MFCESCTVGEEDDISCKSCQIGNSETPAVLEFVILREVNSEK